MKTLKSNLFCVFVLLVFSCKQDPPANKLLPDNAVSAIQKDSLPKPVFGDEELEKDPFDMYHCYPLSSMYVFEYAVGNRYFDGIWKRYKTDPHTQVFQERDACLGDYCLSYEKLTHSKDQVKIFFFKGEAGEYGFDNSQFVFRNDSLVFSRSFGVGLLEFSTDTSESVWEIKETITRFDPGKRRAVSVAKETRSEDLSQFDYSMKQVPAIKSRSSYATWSAESVKEIQLGVELKKKSEKYN